MNMNMDMNMDMNMNMDMDMDMNESNAINKYNVVAYPAASQQQAMDFFSQKFACDTDCSDVYADIKNNQQHFILLDVRSTEAFIKSHAITALNMPNDQINK